MKYYARKGTKYEVYFCRAPWVEISMWEYWFERIVMRNECLKKAPNT